MTRIFVTMATCNATALLAAFVMGLVFMWERDSGVKAPAADQALGWTWFASHMVIGLFASVLTLMVHCLIFTYFLGTGRWVKEVARAYQLPDADMPKLTREFKRKAFPPALFAMLITIATAATGAGAQTTPESFWGWSHAVLPLIALAINAWAYVVEYRTVKANSEIMERIMDEVERRRRTVSE